jgi:hypothetical protein
MPSICCVPGTICFEMMKGGPAAFVALIIGLIAAGIALNQYRVTRAKLNLDLFEKREPIFHKTWGVLSTAQNTKSRPYGGSDPEFTNLLPQAKFLFGPEIKAYMELINANMIELWMLDQNAIHQVADNNKRYELSMWFSHEATVGVKEKFGKYLDFGQWT